MGDKDEYHIAGKGNMKSHPQEQFNVKLTQVSADSCLRDHYFSILPFFPLVVVGNTIFRSSSHGSSSISLLMELWQNIDYVQNEIKERVKGWTNMNMSALNNLYV